MIAVAPRTAGAVTLTATQARRVWNWTLSRQGLHPGRRLSSVHEIASAGLGIHAARLPTPYATVLARAATPEVATSLLARQHDVTTLRCMRKILHLLPLELAAVAHAATAHCRLRDAARLAVNAGVSRPVLDQAVGHVTQLLSDGPLPVRQIEAALAATSGSVAVVRIAVKVAWERGALTYLNESGSWNAERRAFALTSDVHPGLDTTLDPAHAAKELVLAYFARYGPATVRDAVWWSALSRSAVVAALDASGTEWLEVATPWATAPAYVTADQYEEFLGADRDTYTTGLNLLAHEDVALKAYFETRHRYLAGMPQDRAFNQIGEALPTVVLDGQVLGTWAWNPATRAVTPAFPGGQPSRALASRVSAATETLASALRAGWRGRGPHATRHDPNQLALAI